MKRLLCTYQYTVINLIILHVTCRLVSEKCEVVISESCYNCNSDVSEDILCSLDAVIESSENLMKNSTTKRYFFSTSWYLNGGILTPASAGFTAKQPTQTCIETRCIISTNLQLPKGFSSRHHGTYTQTLTTSKEKGGETVSCSIDVCVRDITDISNDIDNKETTDGILIQNLYVYIIAGVAAFFLLLFIVLTITHIRLRMKVKVKNRPPRSQGDDEISVDDVSVAVSNHTYASVQLSVPGRYHTLGGRSPSSRHRYDEPTLDRTDQPLYLEMTAGSSRSASPQRLPHHYENGRKKIAETGGQEVQSKTPNLNIPGTNSVSTVDLIHTRQQKSNMPDVIVHDYQNIRRTRRLT